MTQNRYVAAIFTESANPDGSVTVRPVTVLPYLTPKQLADTLHVSRQTIYNKINDGTLPAARIGSLARISAPDAAAFIEKMRLSEYERPPRKPAGPDPRTPPLFPTEEDE